MAACSAESARCRAATSAAALCRAASSILTVLLCAMPVWCPARCRSRLRAKASVHRAAPRALARCAAFHRIRSTSSITMRAAVRDSMPIAGLAAPVPVVLVPAVRDLSSGRHLTWVAQAERAQSRTVAIRAATQAPTRIVRHRASEEQVQILNPKSADGSISRRRLADRNRRALITAAAFPRDSTNRSRRRHEGEPRIHTLVLPLI
jgi:hypothetical protein